MVSTKLRFLPLSSKYPTARSTSRTYVIVHALLVGAPIGFSFDLGIQIDRGRKPVY